MTKRIQSGQEDPGDDDGVFRGMNVDAQHEGNVIFNEKIAHRGDHLHGGGNAHTRSPRGMADTGRRRAYLESAQRRVKDVGDRLDALNGHLRRVGLTEELGRLEGKIRPHLEEMRNHLEAVRGLLQEVDRMKEN